MTRETDGRSIADWASFYNIEGKVEVRTPRK